MKSMPSQPKKTQSGQAGQKQVVRLEDAVRESELRYRRLFETARDGILIVDAATGRVEDANPYLLDLLGCERGEILTKKVWQLYADAEAAKKAFETLQEKKYLRMDNLPMQGGDGRLIPVESISNVYRVGRSRVVQSNIRDIAEKIRADDALKESERRFRSLIENSQDAIALLDAAGKLIYESPSGLRITGYSLEERIGGSGFDLIHPDDLENVRRNFGQAMQKPGVDMHLQVRSHRKDGEWRWLDVNAVNLLADPAVGAIVINYRDITDRRKAEVALAEAQQTQRLLLESVGEGIHGLDLEGRIMFENAASLQMFGWEADGMLGRNAHELIHHHRADGSLYPPEECPIHRTLRDGETRRVENEVFFRKDGSSFPVEYTCAAMKSGGHITGVVVSFRDVTERKQAEERIRFQADLLAQVSDAIIATDMDRNIQRWNAAAEALYGWRESEVLNRPMHEFIRNEYVFGGSREEALRDLAEQGVWRGELTQNRRDGTRFPLQATVSLIKDARGNPTGMVAINRDITEHKRAEENVQRERLFSDAIINSMPGIFYLFDRQGRFLRWNENFEKVSGYSSAEIAAMHPTDLFEESEKEIIRERIGQVFETGYSFAEANFASRDGSRTPYYFTGVRVELNGQTCLLGVGVDISERKRVEKALTDLSRAVNASGDIVFMTDRDGMITSVNSQFSDLYGYSPDEVVGKTTPRILKSGKQTPQVYENFWAMIMRGELFRGEVINKARDGRLIPIEETVSPFFDERGEIVGFLAIQRDIATRRQAEESLRLAEAKYRALVEQVPITLYMDEADGNSDAYYVSPQIETLLGYTPADFAENPQLWHTLVDPRDYPMARDTIRQTLEEGVSVAEYRMIARSGREVWVRDTSVLVRRADGPPSFIQGFFEDITAQKQAEEKIRAHAADLEKEIAERKRAEQALIKSERDYRYLFNNAGDAILIFEPQGETILQANATACGLYGFEYQEIVGRSLKSLTKNVGRGESYINAFVRGEASNIFESAHIKKNGGEIVVLINSSLIEYEGNTAVLALVRDVTDRKQAEEALQRSEARLSEAQQIAHLGNWEWDIVENSIWWSDETYRIFGLEPREFQATIEGFFGRVHPDDRARVAEALNKALKGEAVYDIDHRILLPDGTEKFLHEQAVLEGDESGSPTRLVGISHDITERLRAEDELRERERHSRSLLRISRNMERATSYHDVLHAAEAEIRDMLGYNSMWIYLLSEDGKSFRALTAIGAQKPRVDEWSVIPIGDDAFLQEIAQAGEIVLVEDARSDPRTDKKMVEIFQNRTIVNIPINLFGKRLGTLGTGSFGDAGVRIPSPSEQRYLVALASHLALALDRIHVETLREQAEENLQRQLSHLRALREIDRAISSSFEIQYNLNILLMHAASELKADAAGILLLNPNLNQLEYAAGYGFRTRAIEKSRLQVNEGLAGRAVVQQALVRIDRLDEYSEQFPRAALLSGEKFTCYYGVPLVAKGVVKGVMEVFHRSPLDPDQDWLDFLHTLAGQAAIAVENGQLFNNLQQTNFELLHAYDATIEGWSRALDLRDKETEGHTRRVTEMAIRLAQKFGLSDDVLKYMRWGGLLHDIGKMGVPDSILLKAESLTVEEEQIMRQHPVFAYEMLSPIRYLKSAAIDIPYCHHEKWDGTGYPRRLKGEQIPFSARIFAMVDVYDAITSDRPYRGKWEKDRAISYIREQAGIYFDPQVVEMFLRMVEIDLL